MAIATCNHSVADRKFAGQPSARQIHFSSATLAIANRCPVRRQIRAKSRPHGFGILQASHAAEKIARSCNERTREKLRDRSGEEHSRSSSPEVPDLKRSRAPIDT